MPLSNTGASPSNVTMPPQVAEYSVILLTSEVLTVGASFTFYLEQPPDSVNETTIINNG